MCWNSQVSLNTFLFATFGALFALFNKYDNKIILWTYVFSFMQFVEYMLWINLKNPSQNKLWSQIGLLSLVVQPLASINVLKNPNLKFWFFISYLFYLSPLFIKIFTNKLSTINFTTTIGLNKHLSWNWFDINFIMLLLWSFFLLAPLFIEKYYVFGFIGLLTLLSSLYFYDLKTFGSVWCWSANITWIVIVALSSGLFSKGCLY